MNITELARILRITPQELRDYLPQMGFDIGQRAIKVDKQTAKKIINAWPAFSRRMAREARAKKQELETVNNDGAKKTIKVPAFVTVRQLADLSGVSVKNILAELMKNGIFTSLNEKIDFDTALIIGADLGLDVQPAEETSADSVDDGERIRTVLANQKDADLISRPPVVVVMGHVDHGKTKLLDSIRKTNVIAGEAGGITQHIGAYQVNRKNHLLTFIDTPGHEAFTAMRNRGARVADIAILVIAADDGVKPQTIEAYRIIEAAQIPFIVAINKIDKPEANIDKVKQELSNQLNIIPEDWGGKTICVPISAKNGEGIDNLLDMLLLIADMEEKELKANPNVFAIGTVVESNIDKSVGIIATILIQNGTLRVGDNLICKNIVYGKARSLKDYKGDTLTSAGPATPVKVIGFKIAPEVGDVIEVGQGEKIKVKKMKSGDFHQQSTQQNDEEAKNNEGAINLIIKSDTLGSGEAIESSLSKIDTYGIKINILNKGLGNITEGDIMKAETNQAQLIGFNINISTQAEELARENKVNVKIYKIIYELINDLKEQVQELVKPEIKRVDLGRMKILAIFRTEKKGQIVGGKVLDGEIKSNSFVEVKRAGEIIEEGKIGVIKIGKEEVERAEVNAECGVSYAGRPVIKVGDILNIYQEEKIYKKVG